MTEHVWVMIQYTTIQDVALQPDGTILKTYTPEAKEVALEQARYGCWICEVPLEPSTINTECDPEK